MARKIDIDRNDTMSLEEYGEFIHDNVDLADFDCLCETAWALKALANDRTFLAQAANRQLSDYLDGTAGARYTANSIVFIRGEYHTVRANIWCPLSAEERKRQLEAPLFSYFDCHDHNYHFVTSAYSGPGYESDLFRYDRAKVEGKIGEKVDIDFVERLKFQQGGLVAYEALNDAHIQHPPEDLSITLNLVARPPVFRDKRQYLFDVQNRTVSQTVDNSQERSAKFLELASQVGDDNTVDLLIALAKTHRAEAVRSIARNQLRIMLPQGHDDVHDQVAQYA